MRRPFRLSRAFSLIELVLVVVIIGVIGAIAIPRFAAAGEHASEVALKQNLAILANAVELYKAEHEGLVPTTRHHLLGYTDIAGDAQATPDATHVYGPYLHKMPVLPMGTNKGRDDLASSGNPGDSATAGWWIDDTTGDVRANAPDSDVTTDGVKINTIVGGLVKG
ncbi:MAG: prepilin-type N-terminal cleavage/methylation domain-containing protein [Phycisphaeraceae bacterium]|nr:MAG: prepilin-type N-terminal cleavage/methylation domain-containing protein [Phycisphaeraceae bacterium]